MSSSSPWLPSSPRLWNPDREPGCDEEQGQGRQSWGCWDLWGLGWCWQGEPPREEREGHIPLFLCWVHLEKGLNSRAAAPSEGKAGIFFILYFFSLQMRSVGPCVCVYGLCRSRVEKSCSHSLLSAQVLLSDLQKCWGSAP